MGLLDKLLAADYSFGQMFVPVDLVTGHELERLDEKG